MDGTSVICYCKNRESNLRISLTSWIFFEEIKEITIIDANSDTPLNDLIRSWFTDQRIKVVRTLEDITLAEGFNLAIRCSSYDKILKLDTDYVLCPLYPFFELNILEPGYFLAGDWQKARSQNELYLSGFLYAYKADLLNVNGYAEIIKTYGWDDSDIQERLEKSGLKKADINLDSIIHISHPDFLRLTRGNGKDTLPELIESNRILCLKRPWTKEDQMCKFVLSKKSANYSLARKT